MGTKAKEIIEMDVDEVIEMLNKALADEWLAYYQYWIGAKVIKGPMREAVTKELEEHAEEELKHANMLTERIIQLGGEPILEPKQWYTKTNCGYEAPNDPITNVILAQNIKGEQCAIDVYNKMINKLRAKDPVTYYIVGEILKDELEHEEDLQAFEEDLEVMKKEVK